VGRYQTYKYSTALAENKKNNSSNETIPITTVCQNQMWRRRRKWKIDQVRFSIKEEEEERKRTNGASSLPASRRL
jgi:hypothetical protein